MSSFRAGARLEACAGHVTQVVPTRLVPNGSTLTRTYVKQRQARREGRSRWQLAAEAVQESVVKEVQQQTELPTRLNDIPHTRDKRRWFYKEVTQAMKAALDDGQTRMKIRCTIPELNSEMDVYRIGTLLEMVREMAYQLAVDGKLVKVCVQQSMGQGVFQGLPLSLSGVRKIMNMMDWGDIGEFVSFGEVGRDQIDDAAYYILIAPQNVVGSTILTNLGDMVDEGEKRGKAVILMNPVLKDIPSSAGIMGVRGRAERMAFADSFVQAYHFRLLYLSSAMMYPIMGAMRHSYGQPWQVWKRQDIGKQEEQYELLASFPAEPQSKELNDCFKNKPVEVDPKKPWWANL
ncbi:hypothetical protein ABBQ38_001673 [Trebouxia sp. C0009 RCD-2024]